MKLLGPNFRKQPTGMLTLPISSTHDGDVGGANVNTVEASLNEQELCNRRLDFCMNKNTDQTLANAHQTWFVPMTASRMLEFDKRFFQPS